MNKHIFKRDFDNFKKGDEFSIVVHDVTAIRICSYSGKHPKYGLTLLLPFSDSVRKFINDDTIYEYIGKDDNLSLKNVSKKLSDLYLEIKGLERVVNNE